MSATNQDARSIFYDSMPFARTLGIEVGDIAPAEVKARLRWTEARCVPS
jgi:acyl-coenzyme A thioesterase PaaI-like protein